MDSQEARKRKVINFLAKRKIWKE